MSDVREQEGVVLLLVMVLIVVTISSVYAMTKTATVEILGSRYRVDRVRADLLARSGSGIALLALQDDVNRGDPLTKAVESTQDAWALLGEQPIEVADDGYLKIHIADVGARINLNALIDPNGEPIGDQSKAFLEATLAQIVASTPAVLEEGSYPDEKIDDLADAILDWIDKNDQTRLGTPEEEYYVGIKRAGAGPLNRPVFSLDELAPIPGLGALLLEAMKSYFTTYPMLPAEGTGGINLNTAPAHVLGLLYHGTGVDFDLIKPRDIVAILRERKEGRVFCQTDSDDERCVTLGRVLGVVGEGEVFFPPLQYTGQVFRIDVEAGFGEARACVTSVVDRSAGPPDGTLYYRLGC